MKTFNTKNLMSKKYITPKIMVKRIDSLHLLAGSPEGKKEVKLERNLKIN